MWRRKKKEKKHIYKLKKWKMLDWIKIEYASKMQEDIQEKSY